MSPDLVPYEACAAAGTQSPGPNCSLAPYVTATTNAVLWPSINQLTHRSLDSKAPWVDMHGCLPPERCLNIARHTRLLLTVLCTIALQPVCPVRAVQ